MLSFVIPFYHKFALWNKLIRRNPNLWGRDREVVLVLDEPSEEKQVLETVRTLSHFIQFRVIVNDETHAWRPPCCAANVDIRYARGSRVAVMSPESILLLPTPDYLSKL